LLANSPQKLNNNSLLFYDNGKKMGIISALMLKLISSPQPLHTPMHAKENSKNKFLI